ncbi:hypothetical protein ACWKW6_12925 [Dyadobacter jiangsuensis]
MKKFIQRSWKWAKQEWHSNVATMKTRGFLVVNVVWFAAGGLFFQLLPQRDPGEDQLNYLLNQVLIIVAILPIYFAEVLTLSNWIDRAISWLLRWINGKRSNNRV